MEIERKTPNEIVITFQNSTPTIGALLQKELLKDPNVTFAGYSCPHPLETKMIVTLITSGKNPREVITATFNNLVNKLEELYRAVESFDSSN